MYARVSDITVPIDQVDRAISGFNEQVVPTVGGTDGFVRAYLLVDRAGGRSLAITVWESEEAMRASEESASQLRTSVAGDASATDVSVSRYEVVVSEPAS
jgi:heme-degrading monooxygenase HmoA